MALRSGYYGLKKSAINALMSLASQTAGMKVIKSFGDGLNLTSAGKLNLTAATANKLGGVKVGDGLSIEDGVLSVDGDIGGYTEDLLYGSTTITYPPAQLSDYTLAHDIKDYDVIRIIAGFTSSDVFCVECWECPAKILDAIPTAQTDPSLQFVFPVNAGGTTGGQWLRLSKGSADNIIHARYNDAAGVYQIYGIKY